MFYDDKTCVICCKKFKTTEEHDEHYKKCANDNAKDDYTDEEVFDIIHYEDNF